MENNTYVMRIKVEADEINEIFRKMDEAKKTIRECCYRLDAPNIVSLSGTISEDSPKEFKTPDFEQ